MGYDEVVGHWRISAVHTINVYVSLMLVQVSKLVFFLLSPFTPCARSAFCFGMSRTGVSRVSSVMLRLRRHSCDFCSEPLDQNQSRVCTAAREVGKSDSSPTCREGQERERDLPKHGCHLLLSSLEPGARLSERCLMGKKVRSCEYVVKFFLPLRNLKPN